MLNYKKVHCIGIGGIHVSALAKLLLSWGVDVSGSDLEQSEITDELQKMGARIVIGHDKNNLQTEAPEGEQAFARLQGGDGVDLVIYSDAVSDDNTERVEAKRLGIRQVSSYEFIGELSKDYYTIAVSGTNGKSTTTAMLGLIMEAAGMDPTVIVGTKVNEWGGNIRIGESKYLVTEADEYKAHMLKLHPKMTVLTNIEEDHLDFYKNLDDIVLHFKKYVKKLPDDGVLVYNEDDGVTAGMLDGLSCRKMGYGVGDGCLKLSRMSSNDSNDEVFDVRLQVPGEFNKYNAAGAVVAARELEIDDEIIKKSLEDFKGTWRRFETVGEINGALVISDYAHHPTAVAGTIKAAREMYPDRRLVVVFQPHQHNRTRMLFDGFVAAFAKAMAAKLVDVIIISEVYDVAGRTSGADKDVSSKDLVEAIKKREKRKDPSTRLLRPSSGQVGAGKRERDVLCGGDLEETRGLTVQTVKPGDVALIMGAGSIDEVARGLVK